VDLSALNAAQRRAVTTRDGARLVVAGAGTGKTRTLVHRVAWLIEQGVAPQSIVLLTFTRRAAAEMLDRASALIGSEARDVRGGTFHGFANTVLRRWAPQLGYTARFTILDRADAEQLVGLCREELGLGGKGQTFPKRNTVLKVLSKQVNTGRDLYDLLEEDYPQYRDLAGDLARLGERYTERKRRGDVMDFDDLLVRFDELLTTVPAARDRVSEGCRYVLVDEYQDTNRLQGRIACLLAVRHGNLMVVGDEAQSIYGFRGATVQNILGFSELFPGCETILLEQNFRSRQPILDLANGVLDSATSGYGKRLFTESDDGALPALVDVENEYDQADYVVSEVLRLREQGVPLREQAVLFRSAFHANLLEVALAREGLPFRKFGGIQFVEAAHVKDLLALLRLVVNPRDDLAWFRVLQWFPGIGPKRARAMITAVGEADPPRLDPQPFKGRKSYAGLVTLASVLREAEDRLDDVSALVDHLLDYYRAKIEDLYPEDFPKRKRDLDTLGLLAARYATPELLLAEVSLESPETDDIEEEPEDEEEWLTLSTIHSAKGLEWDAVFVIQLSDGNFPSRYALDSLEGVEEERRLFYVAVTRAREHLHLVRPAFTRTGGYGEASCLLLDTIDALDERVAWKPWHPAPPPQDPEILRAEERLQRFLDFYR